MPLRHGQPDLRHQDLVGTGAEQEPDPAQDVELRGVVEVAYGLVDGPGCGDAQPGGRTPQAGEHHAQRPAPGEQPDRELLAGRVVGVGGELVERGRRRARWESAQRVDEVGDHREVQHPGQHDQQGAIGVGQAGVPDARGERGREVGGCRLLEDLADLDACALQAVQVLGEMAVEGAECLPGMPVRIPQFGDLRQGEPEIGEALDPQDPDEMRDAVLLVAVGAAPWLLQQADVVVVPHRSHGGTGEFGELACTPRHS